MFLTISSLYLCILKKNEPNLANQHDKGVAFTSVGVIVNEDTKEVTPLDLSAGKGKYLANIRQLTESTNYEHTGG